MSLPDHLERFARQSDGEVESFDDERGLGRLTSSFGATFAFHCTAIADGSRTIAVGEKVRFHLVAGRGGAIEADEVTPRAEKTSRVRR